MAWTSAEMAAARRAARAWRLRTTPWRDAAELLGARDLLFAAADDPERARKRQLGVERVRLWEMRHDDTLPHELLSTRSLVEAQLAAAQDSALASGVVQDLLAHAFARFVTGCCDAVRDERDMTGQARLLGFPDHWVLMRHRIVHRFDTPDIGVLARAVADALKYLRETCWDFGVRASDREAPDPARLEAMLSTYRKERIQELRSGKLGSAPEDCNASTIARDLANCIGDDDQAVQVTVRLLEPKLYPTNNPPNMDGAFAIWDTLLTALTSASSEFLPKLLDRILETMTALDTSEPENDTRKQCASVWIKHIVQGLDQTADHMVKQVFFSCLERPTYWSNRLATDVVKFMNRNHREHYESFWSDVQTDDGEQEVTAEQPKNDAGDSKLAAEIQRATSETLPQLRTGGWQKHEGSWVPKPIGVL